VGHYQEGNIVATAQQLDEAAPRPASDVRDATGDGEVRADQPQGRGELDPVAPVLDAQPLVFGIGIAVVAHVGQVKVGWPSARLGLVIVG
jgi:hypothetical protein